MVIVSDNPAAVSVIASLSVAVLSVVSESLVEVSVRVARIEGGLAASGSLPPVGEVAYHWPRSNRVR